MTTGAERMAATTLDDWLSARPAVGGDYAADVRSFSPFLRQGSELLGALPPKPHRGRAEREAAERILDVGRAARHDFLAAHRATLYRALTDDLRRYVRIEELAYSAAERVPGLVPDGATLEAEMALPQKDKEGHEVDQGILFGHFLAEPECGRHLCRAMLRPRSEALELQGRLARDGRVDLGAASVERHGAASVVTMNNPRFLNAEDASTLNAVETAVDLALLDPETSACVLRGARIEGGKYDGRRVFCAGINLTRLYWGEIPYLWYLVRELGFVAKMYRGLAGDGMPDEELADDIEKPWIAVVEQFAIGGGCQYLLVMDYVLASDDAYMTLPARKEGIIPGAANLRLPRFVADRIARQAVMYDRRIDCDSPEGRLICDELVSADRIDTALDEVVARLTSSGVVSVASNRRAFRINQEPIDDFRRYMALYAREQALCHVSPALIANLERFWLADRRAA